MQKKKKQNGSMKEQMEGIAISIAPVKLEKEISTKEKDERKQMKEGGKGIEALRKEAPEVVARMGYQEGGMMPDEQMEDNYLDFIIEQSLNPEQEKTLMTKLEADPELSMLFDRVLDTATEFAGSGPVNGPGSGVSDSIPARLSDGEFVFTAKATEQIGADRLQSMMEDAEKEADAMRQDMQEGGEVEEQQVDQFGKPVDQDIPFRISSLAMS